jgi:hypothetical protein
MDYEAAMPVGTALAALGGLLERKGICTTTELAMALGEGALAAEAAGPECAGRARYLGAWAYMVQVADDDGEID